MAGPTGAWARAAAGPQRLRVLAVSRIKGDLVALARVTELLAAQRVDIDAIVATGPLNRPSDVRPPPVGANEDRGAYYAGAHGGYAAEREGEASAVLAVLENIASHVYYVPGRPPHAQRGLRPPRDGGLTARGRVWMAAARGNQMRPTARTCGSGCRWACTRA